MTNDTRPPVAPVPKHYAMFRNGSVCGPLEKSCIEGYFSCQVGFEVDEWLPTGEFFGGSCGLDIIATISPADLALAIEIGKASNDESAKHKRARKQIKRKGGE
jgi:hypothetical protein